MSNDRMWGRTATDEDIAVRVDDDGQLILSPSSAIIVVSGGLTDAQLRALDVPVSGPVTDAQLRASAVPVSGPLTDAALRATAVPVSGPLTDTQLRASGVKTISQCSVLYANTTTGVAALGVKTSSTLDISQIQVATIMILATQATKRDIDISDDGVTWYSLSSTASLPANVGQALGTSVAAMYLRVRLTNNSASTAGDLTIVVTGR